MNPALANADQLYFERGGPSYRFFQRIGLVRGEGPSLRRRIVAFLLITWFPLLLLTLLEGRALGPTPRESFLLDFAAYARFFFAVPILVAAEVVVGPRLVSAGLQFVHADLLRPQDYPAFERAIARTARWREAAWPELIILAFAMVGAWTLTADIVHEQSPVASWRNATVSAAGGAGTRISFAGLWYHLIAVPLVQFLWYRWLWRLFIWVRFLATVSRLDLRLVPTHADQAAGLGFLGIAHTSLGIFATGMSAILSAEIAFRIVFEGARIDSFKLHFIALVVLTELLCLGPLMMFAPVLSRARRAWLRSYSTLVDRYNRAFHEKWVESKQPPAEPLLGSADIQSLADLGNAFDFIRQMKVIPFGQRTALQLAVAAALPGLPLILLVMPIHEIIDLLSGAVF